MTPKLAPRLYLCAVSLLIACANGLAANSIGANARDTGLNSRMLRATSTSSSALIDSSSKTRRALELFTIRNRRALQQGKSSSFWISLEVILTGSESPAFTCSAIFGDVNLKEQFSNAVSGAIASVVAPDTMVMVVSSVCSKEVPTIPTPAPGNTYKDQHHPAMLHIMAEVLLVLKGIASESHVKAALRTPGAVQTVGSAVQLFWYIFAQGAPISSQTAWFRNLDTEVPVPTPLHGMPLAPPPPKPSPLPGMPLAPSPPKPTPSHPTAQPPSAPPSYLQPPSYTQSPPVPSYIPPPSYAVRPPSYVQPPSYGPMPPAYDGVEAFHYVVHAASENVASFEVGYGGIPGYGTSPPAYGLPPSYALRPPGQDNDGPSYAMPPPAYGQPPSYAQSPPVYGA